MRTLLILAGLTLLLGGPASVVARPHHGGRTTTALLAPVGDAAVSGSVTLQSHTHGTAITVQASGLQPGVQYTSLTYDNPTCQLEPYATQDTIGGGPYTADAMGRGQTQGTVSDGVRQIYSVSVRLTSSFQLLACATVGSALGQPRPARRTRR